MTTHLPTRRAPTHRCLLPLLALAALTLAGCGAADNDESSTESSQAIAQVDGQDVTVHQLNYRLRNAFGAQQKPDEAAVRQATDAAARQLVDRALLVERAIATKRDRDPAVMLAIEETRQDILATAYMENIAAAAPAPTDGELLEYYNAHPAKYAKGRLYLVRQIVTDGSVSRADIEKVAQQSPTAEELVAWLHKRGTKVLVTIHSWSPDQMPDPLARRLETLEKGNAIMIAAGQGLAINYLIDVKDAPQTFEQAKASIARTLQEQRRRELIEAEMERLRAEADIAWLGEFRDRMEGQAEAADAEPGEEAGEEAKAPAADGADERKSIIDEGIKGLR